MFQCLQTLKTMSRDVAGDIQGPWIASHDIARASKACRATSPATLWAPVGKVATSPEAQTHVARRRQRCRQSTLAMSPEAHTHVARRRQRHLAGRLQHRQGVKSMSRDVARDVARAPWRCRHRPTPMSRDVARDIRATPPLTLGSLAKLLNEFVLRGLISY